MDEMVLSTLIGLVTGILTSVFGWWLLAHYVVPTIRFSPFISKTYIHKAGYRYRIKLENSGTRGIVDVELMAQLGIKGLLADSPKSWQIAYVPLDSDGARSWRIPRLLPASRAKPGDARRHVLRLNRIKRPHSATRYTLTA